MRTARRRAGALVAIAPLALGVLAGGCGKSYPGGGTAAAVGAGSTAARDPSPASGSPPIPPASATQPGTVSRPSPPAPATATAGRKQPAKRAHHVPPAHPVPPAFQPAPGAPSDEEVRAELAQLSVLQREERVRQLSAAAASLAGLLPWALENKSGTQVSVASVFTDYGLGLACGGLLGRSQLGVAHKTAPCGTLITFTYGGRSITVPVIDRGPYIAGREWDLTGATAEALGFPGLGRIEWSVAE
jgi:rare lipoprotein A (peptidoglycan hydrolase)